MAANKLADELRQLLPLPPATFYILFALTDGDKHGYAIMQHCSESYSHEFRMGPATLYTTIQRLSGLALIEEVASNNEGERRRRCYRLTRQGKLLLEAEIARMEGIVRSARSTKVMAHGTK